MPNVGFGTRCEWRPVRGKQGVWVWRSEDSGLLRLKGRLNARTRRSDGGNERALLRGAAA
eukprot:5649173-Pleurochrysis_carterae.AAC.2